MITPQTPRSFHNRTDRYDPDCMHNGQDSCNTAGIRHNWRKVTSPNQPMDDIQTVYRPELLPGCAATAVLT